MSGVKGKASGKRSRGAKHSGKKEEEAAKPGPQITLPTKQEDSVDAETTARAKEVFSLYDRDGDGCINKSQLMMALRSVGLNPSERELELLMEEIIPPGENIVDLHLFLVFMSRVDRTYDTMEELEEAFRVFDKNASGNIQLDELKHVMLNLGEKLTEDDVADMVSVLEYNDRGEVRYRELIKLMLAETG